MKTYTITNYLGIEYGGHTFCELKDRLSHHIKPSQADECAQKYLGPVLMEEWEIIERGDYPDVIRRIDAEKLEGEMIIKRGCTNQLKKQSIEEINQKERARYHENREERCRKNRESYHENREERRRKKRERHQKNKDEDNRKAREKYHERRLR